MKTFQYKCDLCGKDFRQKAILDSHSRTHGSQRPYCCPLSNCRRRFAGENVRRIILFIKGHIISFTFLDRN